MAIKVPNVLQGVILRAEQISLEEWEGDLLPPEALYCIQRSFHNDYTWEKYKEAQALKSVGSSAMVLLRFRPKPLFRRELQLYQKDLPDFEYV